MKPIDPRNPIGYWIHRSINHRILRLRAWQLLCVALLVLFVSNSIAGDWGGKSWTEGHGSVLIVKRSGVWKTVPTFDKAYESPNERLVMATPYENYSSLVYQWPWLRMLRFAPTHEQWEVTVGASRDLTAQGREVPLAPSEFDELRPLVADAIDARFPNEPWGSRIRHVGPDRRLLRSSFVPNAARLVSFALLPAIIVILVRMLPNKSDLADRRRMRGLCPECGYQLSGLVGATACPECGTPL